MSSMKTRSWHSLYLVYAETVSSVLFICFLIPLHLQYIGHINQIFSLHSHTIMFSAGYSTMENQTTYPTCHFSKLAPGDKVWAGVLFGGVSMVLAVLTALAMHCYHCRWGSARAQHARDADEAARASEVQLSAAHLAASQARTHELEQELAAAQARTSTLQGQIGELEQRCHGFYDELRQG